MTQTVTIIRTGVANTASLAAAFTRIGLVSNITDNKREIEQAERLVLPGVGSFGAGASKLDTIGIRELLVERIGTDRPLLAVCLGMQLLADSSEESPGAKGLGVIETAARRFGRTVTVPQMGWNEVETSADVRLLESGCAYFANSYRLTESADGWATATSDYNSPFIAAMERGGTLACQFHPELSGRWGLSLLARWAGIGAPNVTSPMDGAAATC